ncbi:hypothetical protein [Advenella kashmirensis]|nr:hypothetical protein [Advenella kashmirensis]
MGVGVGTSIGSGASAGVGTGVGTSTVLYDPQRAAEAAPREKADLYGGN